MPVSPAELRPHLSGLMLRDQHLLGRRLEQAAARREPAERDQALQRLLAGIEEAAARVQARRLAVPVISYPPELPISQRKDDIAQAINDHQVVVVAGETGSGKTTQLPKICVELGRGVLGQIGHTQPRRLAARSVAERIASELGTELGAVVGYKVRFADASSDGTLVKLMTDGILLTELRRDRRLLRYDTLIIDEAHERSLNIDFILGYLHQLLPSRPDLKVIITSATIDPERFSRHFASVSAGVVGSGGGAGAGGASAGGGAQGGGAGGEPAPVIEVSGRTYPVEVRYRPLASEGPDDPEPRDQVQAIGDAVDELSREGPGDILVFLSGEREIRDAAEALAGRPGIELLPLYARLSAAEQRRVFQSHHGRRVILATNVAETSLTVPGVKYVIDTGTARVSRYSNRTKVQRLPIEPISRASANQRKGRCGRTAAGVCIRLYSEEDFAGRPEFTDPEIVRTNLASVILRMADLDLGEVAGFPFIDSPDTRNIADGIRLLDELGAVAPEAGRVAAGADLGARAGPRLTETGRMLARLPVDPRLGRMIVEAGRAGCAGEVLVIAAALSIQDPRERPADAREAADAMHRRFAEPGSDFLAFLRLWDYVREQQRELSGSAFRRMCRREYLHYLRVREWQDVHGQLRQAARELGIEAEPRRKAPGGAADAGTKGAPAGQGPQAHVAQLAARPGAQAEPAFPAELADRVHQSLLAGLLSHLGVRDDRDKGQGPGQAGARRRGPAEFAGARGARFAIFPDSVLAKRPPEWVVAAELVETSRLWARVAARVEPQWAEALAPNLVRREFSEPRWDARRGAAMATEKVTLYGLPIVAARPVSLSRIDPARARELFISRALVEGDWQTHHRFFERNRQLIDDALELERRARRRGVVSDDAALFDFYASRVPADVVSARHFDSWWKQARQADPELLTLTPADLAGPAADEVRAEDYPSAWDGLALSYEFEPGEPVDGVTADVPLAALNQLSGDEFSWQVPGLRAELVTELIRSLPKRLRTAFVPAPDVARAALARLGPASGGLLDALAAELRRLGGVPVAREDFDLSKVPPHLLVTFRVTDDGQVLATGKDLDQLRDQVRPRLRAALAAAAAELTRSGIRSWDFGSLPRTFANGQAVGYPALADAGDAVDITLFDTRPEADESMLAGNRRLLLIEVPSGARAVASRLPASAKLAMSRHPYPSAGALLDDCAAAAADEIVRAAGGPAWDADAFAALLEAARPRLAAATADVVSAVAKILMAAHEAEAKLDAAKNPAFRPAAADLRAQLTGLVYPGFVSQSGQRRLPDLARYLRAMSHRLDKAPQDLARDAERMAVVHQVAEEYQAMRDRLGPRARGRADVDAVRWMIEELRVSLFAQVIGAAVPVSPRRIQGALNRIAENGVLQ